jgi:hypothetical protein
MKGIYLTQEGKQEIEAKIAELEKFYMTARKVGVTMERIDWEIQYLKEILSSATILPVEESYKNIKSMYHHNTMREDFEYKYPNGVIIQPK